jgi:molybdopterin molybdotransferase
VRPPGEAVADHQIRNSNGIMLVDLLRRAGAGAVTTTHLADDRALTIRTVQVAVREHDLVITVGGVSAGERDFFPDAFAASDVRETVRGAAIQPGKPIAVGRAPNGAMVVALPGNPVSALVCATLFVRPILDRLLGREPVVAWRDVRLAAPVVPNPRRQAFRPAILERGDLARIPSWAGSGDLVHTAPTTGIVALPVQREPVPADATVPYLPWP